MYKESFKLKELPFRLSPDPEFLYLSKDHSRAKAYMESTVWFTDGFVIITGEVGAGKTTLIETFLRELEKDVLVAQVNQTQISAIEFLQIVLAQFGFKPFKMKKAQLLSTLNSFLIEQYAAGRKVLLIIDEAQNLSRETLEEIRLLSGIETTKDKVLRIILAGQPELNQVLDSPDMLQLAQRVRLRFHLKALTPEDVRNYVLHRLEVAGSNGREIFAEDCFPLIYRYTGGVPRLINSLCDTAMMAAFSDDRDHVLMADVESAIAELRWPEFKQQRGPDDKAANGTAETGRHETGRHEAQFRPLSAEATQDTLAAKRAAAGRPFGRLVVVTDGRTIGEQPLLLGRTIIGRTPENDLQIESRFVSRHHCQIITKANSCVVEDLNSTNGIMVKSRRVRSHNLNDGDVITIGRHDLIYIDERRGKSGDTDSHPVMAQPEGESADEDSTTSDEDDKTQVL
jgi:type II secretory pathway predicted ATPase ExeA